MTLAVVAGLSAAGPVQWKPLGKGQTMKLTATKSAHQNEWAYWLHQEQPGIRGTLVGAIATGTQQEELKTLIEAAPHMLKVLNVIQRVASKEGNKAPANGNAWTLIYQEARTAIAKATETD